MFRLNVGHHEMGGQMVRVWTDEMARYGQFNVVKLTYVESLQLLMGKLNVGEIVVHQDNGDFVTATYGQLIGDLLNR